MLIYLIIGMLLVTAAVTMAQDTKIDITKLSYILAVIISIFIWPIILFEAISKTRSR